MKTKVLNRDELRQFVRSLHMSAVVGLLLGGDRLSCVDEGVALEVEGEIVGVGTIAPEGEQMSGQPTIVAIYVKPEHRGNRYAEIILQATVERCVEREFSNIRLEILSKYLRSAVAALPDPLKNSLDIHDLADIARMHRLLE